MKPDSDEAEKSRSGSLLAGWIKLSTDSWLSMTQAWAGTSSKKDSRFEDIHRDMFMKWMEFYEKEMQPILNMPQLGLTRCYQEKFSQYIDRSNVYRITMADFMRILYVPVEESLRAIDEELDQHAKEGNFSTDLKDYYNKWIKVLESHYMNLYQSPDYLDSMHRVLNAAADLKMARDGMLTDLLKNLPIPTNSDMDELYKEIYRLKRQVRELAKGNEPPASYSLTGEGGVL